MSPNIIRLIVAPCAVAVMTGCHHPAPALDDKSAMEYGQDLMTRTVSPEELPQYSLSLYHAQVDARIREKIREARAAHPYLDKQGIVQLAFQLYPNGQISQLKALNANEHPELTKVALHAVNQAAPFHPCPPEAKPLFRGGALPHRHNINFKIIEPDPIDRGTPRVNYGPDGRRLYNYRPNYPVPPVFVPATPSRAR
jgi:hypothetical protein